MPHTPIRRLAGLTAALGAVGALAAAGALAAPLASAAAGPAHAATAASGPAHAATAATRVSLHTSSLGMILVNGRGRTLYAFTKDSRNKDRCMTTSGCTSTWPMLTSHGKPQAGAGVKGSMLSTITVAGGSHQVTYNGHPLYTYVGDSSAGETDYVGANEFGGTWLAVNAAGKTVK
jgi:predicted lipoprotein with Yx(FWY)xxD motif